MSNFMHCQNIVIVARIRHLVCFSFCVKFWPKFVNIFYPLQNEVSPVVGFPPVYHSVRLRALVTTFPIGCS